MMNDTQKLNYLLAQLGETAERRHVYDSGKYNACANGNYDDAFEEGADYGEVQGARDVLYVLELYVNTYNRLCEPYPDDMQSIGLTELWFDVLQGG